MAKKIGLALIFAAVLMLSACNFPLFGGAPEQDVDVLGTAVAQTVQALNEQNQQQEPAEPQPDEVPPPPEPTATTKPKKTKQPEVVPPTATPLPCNDTLFVKETILDGTQLDKGEAFTKTWTFKNTGTCSWNTGYKLKFAEGNAMGAPASVSLAAAVEPGQEGTFSIDMTAPTEDGTHTGRWEFYADDDEYIGYMTVQIVVKTAFFQVSSVAYSMDDTDITMSCPDDVTVNASITTSAAGKVTYYWQDSESGQSATEALNFDKADTKSVSYDMTITASGDYWAQVYIDDPNHQLFGPAKEFKVTCN